MNKTVELNEIVELIKTQSFKELHAVIAELPFGELVHLLSNLDKNFLEYLVNMFPILIDSSVLKIIPYARRNLIISILTQDNLNKIIQHNDEDEILAILALLNSGNKKKMVKIIPESFMGAFKIRSKYNETQVGWYMSLSYVTMPSFWTCDQALSFIVKSFAKNTIRNKHFSRIYVVDPKDRPIGYVTLSELMACKDKCTKINDLVDTKIQVIRAYQDASEIAKLFRIYHGAFLIVIDRFGKLVGVVNYQQAINLIEAKAAENVLDIGGVGESYSTSLSFLSTCVDRLRWLIIALINSSLSSMVIANYSGFIEEKIALVIIMPIIASLGGNVGIQTLSVVLRSLSHGVYSKGIVAKEVVINILNGLLLGSISSVVVGLIFHSFALSATVAAAMFFNMVWSAFIGSVMPMIISYLGFDETISSGPIITSINDVFGFAIFLSLAKCFM